jgi:hypothetical protein
MKTTRVILVICADKKQNSAFMRFLGSQLTIILRGLFFSKKTELLLEKVKG